jgi:hypothetical protein
MNPSHIEIIASALFGIAIIHTFSASFFEKLSYKHPKHAGLFHLLGEVEVVFGFSVLKIAFFERNNRVVDALGGHVSDAFHFTVRNEIANHAFKKELVEKCFEFAFCFGLATTFESTLSFCKTDAAVSSQELSMARIKTSEFCIKRHKF